MVGRSVRYVRVGTLKDFPVGSGRIVRVARKPIAVFNTGRAIHAVNNICPHLGGPIGSGDLDGTEVTCPYHGMRFDVTTGKSVDSFGHDLQVYDVRVENGEVFVHAWWGKPSTP
jgi:nitrite reductase/ring-hydroxylating ferredoxin subunit